MTDKAATITADPDSPDVLVEPNLGTKPTPKLGLRDIIMSTDDIHIERVEVPEWNVTVGVRTMTGYRRAQMMKRASDPDTGTVDFEHLYPEIVIACCVDPDTQEPIFRESDRDMLNTKAGSALEVIAAAGLKVSGLDKAAEKTLGKGSSKPNGDSTSN